MAEDAFGGAEEIGPATARVPHHLPGSQARFPLLTFEITEVDLDGQSARLLTDGHDNPGTLKIVRAINANHFLEVVNEGFLNLTTVYDKDPATGAHPAVHSRHFGLLGQPVFAQYAGSCTAK